MGPSVSHAHIDLHSEVPPPKALNLILQSRAELVSRGVQVAIKGLEDDILALATEGLEIDYLVRQTDALWIMRLALSMSAPLRAVVSDNGTEHEQWVDLAETTSSEMCVSVGDMVEDDPLKPPFSQFGALYDEALVQSWRQNSREVVIVYHNAIELVRDAFK